MLSVPKQNIRVLINQKQKTVTIIDELDEEPAMGPKVTESYGGKSLHKQSHGESFFALFNNRFGGKGLYVLDEPEAALSPTRQMSMISKMHDLILQESQFVIATHSPIIMAYPNAQILMITSNGLEPIEYTETEHFQVARNFLNNHDQFISHLIE